MVFGPRLDRPTALGQEGRPRATSLGIVAVVVVGIVVLVGAALGEPGMFSGLALFVGLAVAGTALLDRDALGPTVVGHLLFLPAAIGVAVLVVFSSADVLVVSGVVLALTGVASGWADVTDDQVETALGSNVVAYGFALVGLVVVSVAALTAFVFWEALFGLSGGASATTQFVGLLLLSAGVCLCFLVAVLTLPVVQLSPVHERDVTRQRVDVLTRRLVQTIAGLVCAFVLAVLLAPFGATSAVTSAPPVRLLLGVLTMPVVTVPLVATGVVALLVAGSAFVMRRAARASDTRTTQVTGATLAAMAYVFVFVLFVLTTQYVVVVAVLGPVALFAAVLLPLAVYVVVGVAYLGMWSGLVPDRAGPPAMAAAGLVVVAVGAATNDLPAILVFAAVAGGLVAWDAGTYGLGVTAELGHVPPTQRLELYHGVFAVGVGLVAVAGATALEAARRSVATGLGTPEAMALAALGVILLLVPLRG